MKNQSIKSELFIECLEGVSIGFELSKNLAIAIDNRKKNFTQEQVAYTSGKSISTIKRFESGKIDSLFLYALYIDLFGT